MGLSRGFRTARVSRHISPKPILNPGMSIGHFKEQIMLRGGPKQFAQNIADEYRKLYTGGGAPGVLTDVANLYGNGVDKLMRPAPPDDSMDWVRDCLGVDFDGPTAWDRFMNLHKNEGGAIVVNLDGSTRRGYQGWLADLCDPINTAQSVGGIPDGPIEATLMNALMANAYNNWHNNENKFVLISIGNQPSRARLTDTTNVATRDFVRNVFGTNASNQVAYILENAVCDGRCGVLGRLIEKVNKRAAVRCGIVANPIFAHRDRTATKR